MMRGAQSPSQDGSVSLLVSSARDTHLLAAGAPGVHGGIAFGFAAATCFTRLVRRLSEYKIASNES